jgi:hypothetical protein
VGVGGVRVSASPPDTSEGGTVARGRGSGIRRGAVVEDVEDEESIPGGDWDGTDPGVSAARRGISRAGGFSFSFVVRVSRSSMSGWCARMLGEIHGTSFRTIFEKNEGFFLRADDTGSFGTPFVTFTAFMLLLLVGWPSEVDGLLTIARDDRVGVRVLAVESEPSISSGIFSLFLI